MVNAEMRSRGFMVNYELSITNYELSITNYELSITNYEGSITNYEGSIAHYEIEITNYGFDDELRNNYDRVNRTYVKSGIAGIGARCLA